MASTEKPYTFLTPRHAKNPGISWVFWGGIFFVLPFWKGRAKKMPTFSSAFGVYHPRSQGYITQETRTISPAGLSSIMKVCIIFSFCSEIKRPSATQGNGVAKQQALSMGGFSHTRRKETKNHTGTSDTTNLAKSQEKTIEVN